MNNYQQNGFNQNNQTIYPNQPGGGMPPKKNNNNILIVVLISLIAVLLIVVSIVAFNAGKSQKRNVYVQTDSVVQHTDGTKPLEKTDTVNTNNTQENSNNNVVSENIVSNESVSTTPETTTSSITPSGNYSRKNPAPVGVEQVLDYKDDYDDERNFKLSVKIVETIRGEAAFTKLKEAYKYTDPADDGHEYVLAKVNMTLISMNSDKALEASPYDFSAFSSKNEEINDTYTSAPEPRLAGKLYEGASTEGWIVLQVKADDVSPKVAYKINYDGSGGLWFALQ